MSEKVALVTGGCDGIGAATARLLADRGFRTFVTSRTPSENAGTEALALDVGDDASVQACIGTVLDRAGRLDVLVNNAGTGIAGGIEETSLAEASAVFEVNLWGAVRMARAALPIMRAQGCGRIVVLSFAPALIGVPFRGTYCASKFALEAMFESLRGELAGTGVAVSIVKPAGVATSAADRVPRAAEQLPVYRLARERLSRVFDNAMRHGMPPEKAARAVVRAATKRRPRLRYLVGGQARAINFGQRIVPGWAIIAGTTRVVSVLRHAIDAIQLLLALLFIVIPISRMVGASTLRQVIDLGAPRWLIWVANVIELAGAAGLLIGLRRPGFAIVGSACVSCSMIGATALHIRSGTLFADIPWTLVILALGLLVGAIRVRENWTWLSGRVPGWLVLGRRRLCGSR